MPAAYKDISLNAFPVWCKTLETKLTKGKFICGDQFTWYDIMLAGFFVNIVENPNNKGKEFWDKAIEGIPDRVKQYISDFKAEMADYLAARPLSVMGI